MATEIASLSNLSYSGGNYYLDSAGEYILTGNIRIDTDLYIYNDVALINTINVMIIVIGNSLK